MSCGIVGIIAGSVLALAGVATAIMGANEVVEGVTGTNYIKDATGMSDETYAGLYVGLNITSAVGQIAGNAYQKSYTAKQANASERSYESFRDFKKGEGPAGDGKEWHHIVEQSQIKKSGFSPQQIHNTNNITAIDNATHAKISGYYNTKTFDYTGGLSVRDWLAGQSYESQYDFGMEILRIFGVIR